MRHAQVFYPNHSRTYYEATYDHCDVSIKSWPSGHFDEADLHIISANYNRTDSGELIKQACKVWWDSYQEMMSLQQFLDEVKP